MEDRHKYRAWHIIQKRMFDVRGIFITDDSYAEIVEINRSLKTRFVGDSHNIADVILMQCTGLKDKTGKLIFEGDIGEFSGDPILPYTPFKAIVEYNNDYSSYYVNDDPLGDYGNWTLEIIGNKYENPELLRKRDG